MDSIKLENVTKIFKLNHKKEVFFLKKLIGLLNNKKDIFIALKCINLHIKKGECIGLIGPNGCGKSTLLKIIANILKPTSGSVIVHNKVTFFSEVNGCFDLDLPPIRNIFLYGALLGLERKMLSKRVEDILRFADLGSFKDVPLWQFSSGMTIRLAYSIALLTDAQILVFDELFSNIDEIFRQKCITLLNKYKKENRTMIFVSHDLRNIKYFCDKCILLLHGEIKEFDETNKVINAYNLYNSNIV